MRISFRDDEAQPHFRDLSGCDLETWARRNGLPRLPLDTPAFWEFALGREVEAQVAKALIPAFEKSGYQMLSYRCLAWNPYSKTVDFVNEKYQPESNELTDHVDLFGYATHLLPKHVLGVLSVWFGDDPPIIAKPFHVSQAAGYATALGVSEFFIQVVCVIVSGHKTELKLGRTSWFKTADYSAAAVEAAKRVIEHTGRGVAPAPNPSEDSLCKLCRYAGCKRNVNPLKDRGQRFVDRCRARMNDGGDAHAGFASPGGDPIEFDADSFATILQARLWSEHTHSSA